jgi:uncharacterized protein (UPF0548 family)
MQMIWSCLGRKPRLEDWLNRGFPPTVEQGPRPNDRRDCLERIMAVESVGEPKPGGPHRRVARAIFAYEIFPPTLVSPVLLRAPVEVGDTIGILYHFMHGLDLFCGACVLECFDEPGDGVWHTGFKYRTLAGHPELGEETFSVEKDMATGAVVAAFRSWSRPGTWLTWLAAPYTRYAQVHANRAALAHLVLVARQRADANAEGAEAAATSVSCEVRKGAP